MEIKIGDATFIVETSISESVKRLILQNYERTIETGNPEPGLCGGIMLLRLCIRDIKGLPFKAVLNDEGFLSFDSIEKILKLSRGFQVRLFKELNKVVFSDAENCVPVHRSTATEKFVRMFNH